jgi:hypothetical protein
MVKIEPTRSSHEKQHQFVKMIIINNEIITYSYEKLHNMQSINIIRKKNSCEKTS